MTQGRVLAKIANMAELHRRVLIVDDEPSILKAYGRSLSNAGFEVAEARGAADALRRMEGDHFDVILSDVSMPKIDGFTLLRRLRLRSPNSPVILMLDKPDNRAMIRGTELGAFQSLVKPIAPELLVEAASHAVSLRRSRPPIQSLLHRERDERQEPASIPATDAKNEFGRILEKAIQGGTVVITKHDVPKAV